MSKKYAGIAQFLVVYIREAHPTNDWPMRVSREIGFIDDPTNLTQRRDVAVSCVTDLKIDIPTVLDDMNDSIAQNYKSHPDRLYIVGKDGKIAFHGGPGPGGFRPKTLEIALIQELEKIGAKLP
mgnify:CR=1 FL=1